QKAMQLLIPADAVPVPQAGDTSKIITTLFHDWVISEEKDAILAWQERILREGKAQNIETKLKCDTKLVRLIGMPIVGYDDLVQVMVQDLSGAQQNGQPLIQMAYYDQLTGLPNRYLLSDRLHWAISDASRHKEHMAVLAIDFDHFKRINDMFGHQAGDHLIQEISRRMTTCLRDSDTLARIGGDEFTVFMQHVADSQDAVLVAERLLTAISKPIDIMEVPQTISASIGICLYPQDGSEAQELLEKSDIALYRAKNSGRNQYAFFNEAMKKAADRQVDFERRLRQADTNEELTLHYQPIIATASRKVIALEALIRWNSQKDGCLPAASFLPVAEMIGIDRQLADWALYNALFQMKKWLDSGLIDDSDPCRLTVNLSGKQMTSPDMVDQIDRLLIRSGLPAERLILEIRESTLYNQAPQIRKNLDRMSNSSIRLCLDDFNQGFRTMNQIGQIPVTSIKIDQNMTASFLSTYHGEMLLSTMISLAHLLNLEIIAAGVETKDAEENLTRLGCDALQGYWISRPLPAVQTEMLLGLCKP
ncbi:MAG: EAL domain-containing protein, partial [Bacillota bacterium]|nr:EAL domain-containing protein [Bacillota bacterium]